MKFLIQLVLSAFILTSATNSFADTKDCFEKINRGVFSFNQGLDRAIFKPVAKGYSYLPNTIQEGVRNVTSNVSHTVTIPNHFMQGNFKNFYNDSGRFLINTTLGILGIFDPAEKLGFKKLDPEDYGQTLGFWGVGNGCYLMLPVFGPTTIRDAAGKVANTLLDPFYLTTVGDQTVLDNNFGDSTYYVERGFDNVDFRARNLKNFDTLEKNSVDLYSTVRSLYLQKRENLISNSSGSEDEWKNFK